MQRVNAFPLEVAQTKTDAKGKFNLDTKRASEDSVFYSSPRAQGRRRADVVARNFVA